MAKNQGLALNPTKINGVCGRLLCCLNYENDLYTELNKTFSVSEMIKYYFVLLLILIKYKIQYLKCLMAVLYFLKTQDSMI